MNNGIDSFQSIVSLKLQALKVRNEKRKKERKKTKKERIRKTIQKS
jgi:hypothetical protein